MRSATFITPASMHSVKNVMNGTAHSALQAQGVPSTQTLIPSWTQHDCWISVTRVCRSSRWHLPSEKCTSARVFLQLPAKVPKSSMLNAKVEAVRPVTKLPHSSQNGTMTSAQVDAHIGGKAAEQSSASRLSQQMAVISLMSARREKPHDWQPARQPSSSSNAESARSLNTMFICTAVMCSASCFALPPKFS